MTDIWKESIHTVRRMAVLNYVALIFMKWPERFCNITDDNINRVLKLKDSILLNRAVIKFMIKRLFK